jgi:hypothetical protein
MLAGKGQVRLTFHHPCLQLSPQQQFLVITVKLLTKNKPDSNLIVFTPQIYNLNFQHRPKWKFPGWGHLGTFLLICKSWTSMRYGCSCLDLHSQYTIPLPMYSHK